jgi:hypothetical protein
MNLTVDSFIIILLLIQRYFIGKYTQHDFLLISREVQYIVLQNIATMSIQRKVGTL